MQAIYYQNNTGHQRGKSRLQSMHRPSGSPTIVTSGKLLMRFSAVRTRGKGSTATPNTPRQPPRPIALKRPTPPQLQIGSTSATAPMSRRIRWTLS